MVDKTTADAIVARRIFVFKAALAEVGIDPGECRPNGGVNWGWSIHVDPVFSYRAAQLARLAAPVPDEPCNCFDCWTRAGMNGYLADRSCRKIPLEDALRFTSCGATPAAAAAA